MKDLSRNYSDRGLAQKQRDIVDDQLVDLWSGDSLNYFETAGKAAHEMGRSLDQVTLLDVGCGTAHYFEVLEVLKPEWADYIGVDYNTGMLELAAQHYPGLGLCQGNIYSLPFSDQSFDVVLSAACTTHVEDWKRAVDELKRVARTFLFLHRNSMRDVTTLELFRAYDTDLFHWYFNETELLEATHGFSLVKDYVVSSSSTKSYLLKRTQNEQC